HIFSNGFQFRFQKPIEAEPLGYILPHWIEIVPSAVERGFTAILLPLLPGKGELIEAQLSKIAPETVLFLKKLRCLHLGNGRAISATGKPPFITLCSNGDELRYFVHVEPCEKPPDLSE